VIAARWPLAALGAGAAAAAWPLEGTFAGGLLWVIACAVACAGHGHALGRALGLPLAPPLALVAGLAAMLVPSTLLGTLGLFSEPVQRAVVLAGVALAALPPGPWDPGPAGGVGWFRGALGALAALALVALALVRLETPLGDGANHVLAVKRLWDTGALDPAPHTLGLHIIGEALFARGGGAEAAGVFEAACAAFLVLVIAFELPAADTLAARLAFLLAAAVIVLEPPAPGQMSATLFHLAAVLSLRTAIEERRTGWCVLGYAAALAMVRHELVFLAAPYAAAAAALPHVERPSRRSVALALAGWFAAALAIQLALGLPVGNALGKSFGMLAAVPLAALLLHLLGPVPWRSAHGALCLAAASYMIAVAVYAIHPRLHAGSATGATTLAIALLVLAAAVPDPRRGPGAPLRPAAAWLVIAMFAATKLVLPSFGTAANARVAGRFTSAVIALRERMVLGTERGHDAVRAAQLRAPTGARLAFWGVSAARLDLARNPIRDVSFSGGGSREPIAPRALDGVEYLLVEDLMPAPRFERPDPEPRYTPALDRVAGRLELVATEGTAHLLRVR
jgi:hypothetical protein